MSEAIAQMPTEAARNDVQLWQQNGLVGTAPTRHGPMVYFKHDRGALTSSLQAYGEWAENEIMFCKRFFSQGDIVLDVGAYIGSHSLAFAAFVGPTGHVYSFEAQPASFTLLAHNLFVSGMPNVTATNAAVGAPVAEASIPLDEIDISQVCSFGSAAVSASGGGQRWIQVLKRRRWISSISDVAHSSRLTLRAWKTRCLRALSNCCVHAHRSCMLSVIPWMPEAGS